MPRDENPRLAPFYETLDAREMRTNPPFTDYSPGDLRIDTHAWAAIPYPAAHSEPQLHLSAPPDLVPVQMDGSRVSCSLVLGSALLVIAAVVLIIARLTGAL